MTAEPGLELGPPAPVSGLCRVDEGRPGTAEREQAPPLVGPGQRRAPWGRLVDSVVDVEHPGSAEREQAPPHVGPGPSRALDGSGEGSLLVVLPQTGVVVLPQTGSEDRKGRSHFFLPPLGFWVGLLCWPPCLPPWLAWPPRLRLRLGGL